MLGTILSAIIALKEIIFAAIKMWKVVAEMKRKQRVEDTVDAINKGDTKKIEEGLNNPDAGEPSGIGKVRDKRK